MAGFSTRALKTYLSAMDQPQLQNEIMSLVKTYPCLKDFYAVKLDPSTEDDLLHKAKLKLHREFFPERGCGKARASEVNGIISQFKKLPVSPKAIIELLLYATDIGVEYTEAYGDIDAPFYQRIERLYDEALTMITTFDLGSDYQQYAQQLRQRSSHIGWGFGYHMDQIYEEFATLQTKDSEC